jgi:hypothetical protein
MINNPPPTPNRPVREPTSRPALIALGRPLRQLIPRMVSPDEQQPDQ